MANNLKSLNQLALSPSINYKTLDKYMKTIKVSSVDKTSSVKKILINRCRNLQSFTSTTNISCGKSQRKKISFCDSVNINNQKQLKQKKNFQKLCAIPDGYPMISKLAFIEYMNMDQSTTYNQNPDNNSRKKPPKFFKNSNCIQYKKSQFKNNQNLFESTINSSKNSSSTKIYDIFQQQSQYFNTTSHKTVVSRLQEQKKNKRKQYLKGLKKVILRQQQIKRTKQSFQLESKIFQHLINKLKKRQLDNNSSFTVCSIYSQGLKKSCQDTSVQNQKTRNQCKQL